MEGKMVLTRTKKIAECHLFTTWAMFLNICCFCVCVSHPRATIQYSIEKDSST